MTEADPFTIDRNYKLQEKLGRKVNEDDFPWEEVIQFKQGNNS